LLSVIGEMAPPASNAGSEELSAAATPAKQAAVPSEENAGENEVQPLETPFRSTVAAMMFESPTALAATPMQPASANMHRQATADAAAGAAHGESALAFLMNPGSPPEADGKTDTPAVSDGAYFVPAPPSASKPPVGLPRSTPKSATQPRDTAPALSHHQQVPAAHTQSEEPQHAPNSNEQNDEDFRRAIQSMFSWCFRVARELISFFRGAQ